MIKPIVTDWHSKLRNVALKEFEGFGYILDLFQGKTDKEALNGAAKELDKLSKECKKMAKEIDSDKKASRR